MRQKVTLACALVMLMALAVTPMLAQESAATKSIAAILATVNHFPNDADKKTLTTLSSQASTTEQEKVLITAMLAMQHSVTAADKPKVEAVAKDAKASAGVKQIATILASFLHTASEADKAALKKLAG